MSDLTKTLFIPLPEKKFIAQTTSTISNSDDQRNKFADEHQNFNICLDGKERATWQATINIEIKLASNLDESINSNMGSKRFSKLSTKDIFEKSSRNLKTKLNTIPLCSGRFEKVTLQHPRLQSNVECYIFVDENDKFDAPSFESSIMLFNLLDMIKDKSINKIIVHTDIICAR